jgi:hypothetical protein
VEVLLRGKVCPGLTNELLLGSEFFLAGALGELVLILKLKILRF